MAEPIMRNVTREEFEKFIAEHGEKLERDVYGAAEPPLVTYNDFSMAPKWPESIVASTFLYSDEPGHYYYVPEKERIYRIIENYNEIVTEIKDHRRGKIVAKFLKNVEIADGKHKILINEGETLTVASQNEQFYELRKTNGWGTMAPKSSEGDIYEILEV